MCIRDSNLYRDALRLRRETDALGAGSLSWSDAGDGVLAFTRDPGFGSLTTFGGPTTLPDSADVLLASQPVAADGTVPAETTVWSVSYTHLDVYKRQRQDLQPATYPRENLFTEVVRRLQTFDSQSNVCPSLHVYTTLCVNDALQSSKLLKQPEIVRPASWVLTGLISASTCFLKQHSVLDGIAAAGLFGVLKAAPRLLRP